VNLLYFYYYIIYQTRHCLSQLQHITPQIYICLLYCICKNPSEVKQITLYSVFPTVFIGYNYILQAFKVLLISGFYSLEFISYFSQPLQLICSILVLFLTAWRGRYSIASRYIFFVFSFPFFAPLMFTQKCIKISGKT